MTRPVTLLVVVGLLPLFASAQAHQSPSPPKTHPPAAPVERPETWDLPPSRVQVEQDPTLIPVGKGALFVPAMTDPRREPMYLVYRDGSLVASQATGSRTVLDPGVFEVIIGSGPLQDRLRRRVLIREGRTTVVPATWSALVVHVVDERSEPFRGSYELVHLPDRRDVGVGLGADVERGEEVRTWILPPGTYLILKTGESYQARRDFFTVRLLPGEVHRISLVMDRETGAILGAGEVVLAEPQTALKDWHLSLLVGADGEFSRRSDLVGFPSGYGFTLGGFLDFLARYRPERHYLYGRFKVEEKQVKVPGQPFQKDQDEAKLDILYVYRVLPWLGPYLRGGARTALLPSYLYLSDATEVIEVNRAGTPFGTFGTREGRFRLSNPFAPVEVKGGAGLGVLALWSYILDANLRVGFGGRALFNRGLLSPVGKDSDGRYRVFRRANAYQYGLEATLVASATLGRLILLTTEFDFLEPIQDPRHPSLTWENNVSLRLLSFVSLNYVFRMIYDIERLNRLQTEHRLLLRFTWKVL